ncbi:hypothetical protein JZ751_001689 [Albula glossodonta]|uniref:Uncharacterized protein n=1 Tax=Albula glossodonta TaxID=121402 RepID=A0A8T2PUQ0_9TELE|nr:hypothetical protein JZ751_001689 [Albula glossodonta]
MGSTGCRDQLESTAKTANVTVITLPRTPPSLPLFPILSLRTLRIIFQRSLVTAIDPSPLMPLFINVVVHIAASGFKPLPTHPPTSPFPRTLTPKA